jgi:penicillin-binding protein 1A
MQPMPSAYSSKSLKLWGNVMAKAHEGLKAKEFENSSYALEKFYCTETGNLATDSCPNKAIGWYRKSNVPEVCTAHAGEPLGNPADMPTEEAPEADTSSAQ